MKAWTFIALLLGFSSAPSQEEARPSLPTHFFAESPRIDGELDEWQGLSAAVLDREEQLNRFPDNALGRDWRGKEDCSGRFFVGATHTDLLIAGDVWDDIHVDPGNPWWSGDAIELFLCTNPKEGEAAAYDEDDYQIFLMPMHPENRWGVAIHNGIMGQSDGGFFGVRVEGRPHERGFTFEAAIPLANFPELLEGPGFLGINFALDDADVQGGPVRNYMVWTGEEKIYLDRGRMGILAWDGRPLAGSQPGFLDGGAWLGFLLVLGALGLLAFFFYLARRIYQSLDHTPSPTRMGAILVAVFVLSVGAAAVWRFEINRQTLAEISQDHEKIQDILGTYAEHVAGAGEEQGHGEDLVRLLSGQAISTNSPRDYRPLPVGLPAPVHYSESSGIPFFDYQVELPAGLLTSFDFFPARQATRVAVAIGIKEIPGRRPPFSQDPLPAFDLVLRHPQGQPTRLELRLEEAQDRVPTADGEEPLVFIRELEGPLAVERLEILGRGGSGRTFYLKGVSFFGTDRWEQAALGFSSLPGIPTLASETTSRAGGVELLAGSKTRGEFSMPLQEPADRLWIFSLVDSEGSLRDDDYGTPTLEVMLQGGVAEETRTLRKGIDIHHYDLDLSSHSSDMESAVAFHWEEAGGRYHIDVHELTLGEDHAWDRVVLRNVSTSGIPIRILGMTAGIRKSSPPLPASGPLERSDQGFRLLPPWRDSLDRVRYSFFDARGMFAASYHPDREVPQADTSKLAVEEISSLGESREGSGALLLPDQGRKGIYRGLFPVRTVDNRLLGFLEAGHYRPSALFWRDVAGALPFVSLIFLLPFFLIALAEVLGGLGRIRTKLLGAFFLTSMVPLVFLLVSLSNHLLDRYRSSEDKTLQAAAAAVEQKYYGQRDALSRAAASFGRAFLDHPRIRRVLARSEEENYPQALQRELASLRDLVQGGERWSFVRMIDYIPSGKGYRKVTATDGAGDWEHAAIAESDFFRAWGKILVAGSFHVQEGRRRFAFIIGEELQEVREGGMLTRLYTPEGFPVAGASPAGLEREPEKILEFKEHLSQAAGLDRPYVQSLTLEDGEYQFAFAPLRGRQGGTQAFLGIGRPRRQYLLSLGITEIPLTHALLLFAGIIAISAFAVVRNLIFRITGPIEKLEAGARELKGGSGTVPLIPHSEDEIGHLTRTFNDMAGALAKRFRDFATLNQGLRELTSHLESHQVAARAVQLLRRAVGNGKVFLVLGGPGQNSLQWFGEEGRELAFPHRNAFVLRTEASRHFLVATEAEKESLHGLPGLARGTEGILFALPLQVRGRSVGVVLVLARQLPDSVEKEFLQAAAGQVAIALENARLYRLAIEDTSTGTYNGTYFRARLADEIETARKKQAALSLLRVSLRSLEGILSRASAGENQSMLEKIGGRLQRATPQGAMIGRAGLADFHILLPGSTKSKALEVADGVRKDLEDLPLPRPGATPLQLRVRIGVAEYPGDGPSADFLLHELDPRSIQGRGAVAGVHDVSSHADSVSLETPSGTAVIRSSRMLEILNTIDRIAGSELAVILQGETGVGKEIMADWIHLQSARAAGPMIKINCAALPEGILESELFGFEKGAFTGAEQRRPGKFELAHKGTIFLDEVGELSPEVQAKLLRVIQEKKVTRLGGSQPISVDVRIVSATNKDLQGAMEEGRFRSDLYYRLHGISLVIPPLRERKEEIPEIVKLVIRDFNQEQGRSLQGFSSGVLDLLFREDWPGNIRQLRNVIERACLMCEGDEVKTEHIQLDSPLRKEWIPRPARAPRQPLSERQLGLLKLLKREKSITTMKYVKLAEVSRRTALRDLAEMVDKGYLVRRGKRRAAEYQLP